MSGKTFSLQVTPILPVSIERLADLASNFWFSWHRPTRRLFRMLDRELWWKVGRNPSVFLRCVDQGILNQAAENETFLSAYRRVLVEFDAYLAQGLTGYKRAGLEDDDLIAYFCAEYGYHESVPIYSGGLGILAGDHCKSASDMRLPFVGVGLLYRRGYFRQRIDGHGVQIAEYPTIDPADTPVRPQLSESGKQVCVHCEFPGRRVHVRVWRADVGRVPVLLLDTDVEDNDNADRSITRVLYGGDNEHRMKQEIILGVGGVKALRAAGMSPAVWHVNEGHAAFSILERARELVAQGLGFAAAVEAVTASTVFTTHTPVLAGHDIFPKDLFFKYFSGFVRELNVEEKALFSLGAAAGDADSFDMTRLAIAGSDAVNGVSHIHRGVAAEMCADMWPEIPTDETPVGYVTNGVHVPTFMQQEWAELLEQYLGPAWRFQFMDRGLLDSIRDIPDGRFWYVNQQVKSEMLAALRTRLEHQFARNQVSESHSKRMLKYIDPDNPDALTIGFGRRFATYKRANLLFNNLDWLREIVDADERPVVFLFAGKAHPADEPGKQIINEIHRVAGMPGLVGKVLLVEGYDMGLGRLLTAGVDVWLNTPTYPMEASGTSGMKAAINGTVNLSVLDGWWAEAYNGENGWAIPASPGSGNAAERDNYDARTLYEILQDNVVSQYYDRDPKHGYSPSWVKRCKESMASILPGFNSYRVLHDYACHFYGPAARHGKVMATGHWAAATELAEWKARVQAVWPRVSLRMASEPQHHATSDGRLRLDIEVDTAGLQPDELRVECVLRRIIASETMVPVPQFAADARAEDGFRHIGENAVAVARLRHDPEASSGKQSLYRLDYALPWCGALSYEVRAFPQHENLSHPYEMGMMRRL